MSFESSWYVPGRVIYQRFSGILSPHSLQSVRFESDLYLRQIPNGFLGHFILDVSNVDGLNMSLKDTRNARLFEPHANLGWMVMIGGQDEALNHAINVVMSAAAHVFRIRYHMLSNIEETHLFLRSRDESLFDLLPFLELSA